MQYRMPRKGEKKVCQECQTLTPDKYAKCEQPCHHLVSVVIHEATNLISQAISREKW